MDDKTIGALKRIVKEVKEKRKANCLMKDCIINNMIGGNDIDLVESWIEKYHSEIKELQGLKAGDRVKFKGNFDGHIYTVYDRYSATSVSLGLRDYPDTEADNQTRIKDLVLV